MSTPFLEEFRASAIPDQLTFANIEYWEGEQAVNLMTEGAIARLGGHSNQYATQAVKKLRRDYAHMAAGAWFAWGVSFEGDRGIVPYSKPNQPRQYFDKGKLKKIKYETPKGAEASPILPYVDPETAAAIFKRYRVKPLPGESFWQTVWRCPRIPIGITEGIKKALSMTAHGLPTIALRGVTTWHPKGKLELHEAIAKLATPGRTIAKLTTPGRRVYIAFDKDTKPSAVRNVRLQALKLGNALELAGAKPQYIEWDIAEGKGIDDAIAHQIEGDRQCWFDEVVASALTLNQYRSMGMRAAALGILRQLNRLSYPVERATEGEYIPELPELTPGAIHALSANMNAGKSTRIGADWVSWAKAHGWLTLVLSPLNNLGTQTSSEWNLPHVNDTPDPGELWERVKRAGGVVMCPDSLLKLPRWFIDSPILLVLDEGNKVIKHTAEGDTLGSKYDQTNWQMGEIIQRAIASGAIVLSEDGLPDRAVNFVRAIAGEATPVRVFTHKKQSTPWNCTVWSGEASGYKKRLEQAIGSSRNLYLCSAAVQGEILERRAAKLYPDLKVVRIDGKTNQDGRFKAFFQNPDKWLKDNQPDLLILSPSAESGVSIEGGVSAENAYFSKVWGYFSVHGTDTHIQLLGRYRPPVDREIFVPSFITTGGDEAIATPWGIKRRWQTNTRALAKVHGIAALLDETRDELSLRVEGAIADYLAESRAVVGAQKSIAHDSLVQRLEDSGHNVVTAKAGRDKVTAALWDECREEIWRAYSQSIAEKEITPRHTPAWARKTLDSMDATEADRITAHKVLWRDAFPGVLFDCPEECYEALVKDYGAMRRGVLLQSKAENLEATKQNDAAAAAAALGGKVRSSHRLPRHYARAWVYAQTGILELLDGQSYSNTDPRAIAIKAAALRYAGELGYWLQVYVKPTQTPVEVCNKLLVRIGIDKDQGLNVSRPGGRGEHRDRVYSVDLAFSEVRLRLLEAARRKASEAVSTISLKVEDHQLQIVDTTQNPALCGDFWAAWQHSPDPTYREALISEAIALGLPPNPEQWRAAA